MKIRITKKRIAREQTLAAWIGLRYNDARKNHLLLDKLFSGVHANIEASDLALSQKRALHSRNWALRDFMWNFEAKWQLFLDGEPVTSAQVSVKREGDENVWKRVTGYHVWAGSLDRFVEKRSDSDDLVSGSPQESA